MPLDLSNQDLQLIAQAFATEFKDAGVFDPTGGGGPETPEERKKRLAAAKAAKTEKEKLNTSQKLIKGFGKLGGATNSLEFAFNRVKNNLGAVFSTAALTRGIGKGISDFEAQLNQGAIATGGVFDQMVRSATLAVDPQVLSNLSNANRQAVIAMGGVQQWYRTLDDTQSAMFNYTGDLAKALELTSGAMQTMRMAGITPVTDMLVDVNTGALQGFGKTLRNISVMTNKNMSEVNQQIATMVEGETMRWRLAGRITKEGRRTELEELANRQEMLLMLGYSTEQAERAGDALNELAGRDPRQRRKDAFKAAAAMAQVGMGSQGQRFAQLEIMGARRNPQEEKEFVKIAAEYQKRAAQSQYGTESQELVTMSMYAKAGMERLKVFTKVASKDYEENLEQSMTGEKALKTMGEVHTDTTALVKLSQQIKNLIFENPLSGILAGLVGLGATLVSHTPILLGILRNTAVSALGGGAGAAGIFKKLLKGAGAVAAIAGLFSQVTSWFDGFTKEFRASGSVGKSILAGFAQIGDDIFGFFGDAGAQAKKEMEADFRKLFDAWDWMLELFGVKTSIADADREAIQQSNSQRGQAWVAGTNRKDFQTDTMFEAQKQFANQVITRAQESGQVKSFNEESHELLNIATLLERLNLQLEDGTKLSQQQLHTLSRIAEDNEISAAEQKVANRLTRTSNMRFAGTN